MEGGALAWKRGNAGFSQGSATQPWTSPSGSHGWKHAVRAASTRPPTRPPKPSAQVTCPPLVHITYALPRYTHEAGRRTGPRHQGAHPPTHLRACASECSMPPASRPRPVKSLTMTSTCSGSSTSSMAPASVQTGRRAVCVGGGVGGGRGTKLGARAGGSGRHQIQHTCGAQMRGCMSLTNKASRCRGVEACACLGARMPACLPHVSGLGLL